jgi:CHAT domain-containing protein/tetratricopeptide (TPR) repeat protein
VPPASADSARLITRQALRAVEGDSAAAVEARWRRRRDPLALLGLATLARLRYQYERADSLAHTILARADASGPVALQAHLALASASIAAGNWVRADSAYRAAAAYARATTDTSALAESLSGLAVTQGRLAGLGQALPLADSAWALSPARDVALRAVIQCRRADLLESLSDSTAPAEARAGIVLARAAGERRTEAACLRVLARHARRLDAAGAAAIMGAVAELQRLARDDAGRATTLQWRGYTYSTIGEFGLARADLDAAVSLALTSRNDAVLAWASLNLANTSQFFGDTRAALRLAAYAESLFTVQGDRMGLVLTMSTRSRAAMVNGDYDAAEPLLRESLARASDVGGPWPKFGYKALADLAIARGDWTAALAHLDSAAAMARAEGEIAYVNGLEHPYALVAFRQGRLADARRMLRRTIAVLADDPQRSRRYVAHTLLGAVYARQGDLDAASRELSAAADTLDQWRASLGTADLRLAAYAVREEDLATDFGFTAALVDLARGDRAGTAFTLAERRRARDLGDRMLRVAALDAVPAATPRTPSRSAASPLDAAAVRAAIPDDSTALVEFVVSGAAEPSIAFVVTRQGMTAAVLPPGREIRELTETMLALIEAGEGTDSMARQAGRLLWAPVETLLPEHVVRLVLVPDGPLHRLPFDALVLADGRRVAERFAVAVTPSATIAAGLWRRAPSAGQGTLLAFGAPRFPPLPAEWRESAGPTAAAARPLGAAVTTRGGDFMPLPASAGEVKAAGRIAPGAVVRLGAGASESYLKAADAARYRIIHFATHALVDDESLDRTGLVLAPGDGEDGLVSPAELAALRLDADLVVLSGCRTARGVVFTGEGVEGLAGPLLEAGTRSVLATLWSVGDRDAARFMGDFYRAASSGITIGDAVAQAKRTAMARGEPPSVWAAFVLVGNPVVRPSLPSPAAPRGAPVWRALLLAAVALGLASLARAWRAGRRRRA